MRKIKVKMLAGFILLLSISMAGVANASSLSELDLGQGVSGGDLPVTEGIEILEESEPIQVVLPTDFVVLMYEEPGKEGVQIQSQDIVLVNRSDFSVNIKVKEITYEIEEGVEWGTNNWLQLNVKEFQKEEYTVPCLGQSFVPFHISLDKKREETNVENLMSAAEAWNPVGEVNSADYSILRLEGAIDSISDLKGKDVEVGIVFEFERE